MKYNHSILCHALALTFLATAPGLRSQTTAAFTTLHSFTRGDSTDTNAEGSSPEDALVQGRDGNFYGVSAALGAYGSGTVTRITPGGGVTVLYNFTARDDKFVNTDGAVPSGRLALGRDGNFYGTTASGGPNSTGTIFKITPAGMLTTLHRFSAAPYPDYVNSDGANPNGGLLLANDGNFYGTAYDGGVYGYGTIFKLTPAGALTPLHSFGSQDFDGQNPHAALVEGQDGNFYGTTYGGGTGGQGTVFRMTPAGKVTILHSFGNDFPAEDGALLFGGLVMGKDGNFYGTTAEGGTGNGDNGDGTIFKITPAGKLTTLHRFSDVDGNSANADGARPYDTLAPGSDGNFYGTTKFGGKNGNGVVFQVTPTGKVTNLHSFSATADNISNADGFHPLAGMVQGSNGAFYGMGGIGGTYGGGTLFKVALAPEITSAATATAAVGKAFSYQITASFNPTSYSVLGLPPGLTVNRTTGVISGTLSAAGTHTLTLKAANAAGTGTKTLTLKVVEPPVVTSAATATATMGKAFSYQITATNSPTSYGVVGLKPGLSVNRTTGLISGTPTGAAGTYTLTLKAVNSAGTGVKSLKLTIKSN